MALYFQRQQCSKRNNKSKCRKKITELLESNSGNESTGIVITSREEGSANERISRKMGHLEPE